MQDSLMVQGPFLQKKIHQRLKMRINYHEKGYTRLKISYLS